MTGRRYWIALVVSVSVLGAVCTLLPWMGTRYALVWMFLFSVWLTLAVSYDIVGGHLGYMNLGHSAFFGLGAYATVLLLNLGCSLPTSLGAAALLAASVAVLISWPLFRLRGAYFALGTFGLISLMAAVVTNLRDWTGGSGGISAPPGDHTVAACYLSMAVAGCTMALRYHLARSHFGLTLRAIREDEEAARGLAAQVILYKCAALVLSSIPAGVIGGVYAWNLTYISPDSVFGLEVALSPVVMAMLGGTGALAGPVLGVCFVTVVQELLWTKMPYFHLTVYGAIMVCVGLFLPGGLVRAGWLRSLARRTGILPVMDRRDACPTFRSSQ